MRIYKTKINNNLYFSYVQNGVPFNTDFIYFMENPKYEFGLLENQTRKLLLILSFLWIDLLPLIYMNLI
jgi:hypothetical protein